MEKMNGVMVFYIDVGQLPPFKAEAVISRMQDQLQKQREKLQDNGIECIWIPLRPNSQTRVEYLPLSEEGQEIKVSSTNLAVEILEE